MRPAFAGLCCLLASACPPASGETPAPDGGGLEVTPVAPPSPPQAPEAVTLTPCPAGWQEVPGASGAPSTCEPWPAAGPGACAADEARFPGDATCGRVGTACGADEWAVGLPGASVLYVRAGATGGDGSRATPYGSIAAAMAVATPGATVALGAGTFSEPVTLRPGVTLWGACVAQTFLTAPAAANCAVVKTAGLGGRMKNLRLGGPCVGVRVNPSGNTVALEGVVVDGAQGIGILAGNGASVTGHDVVVRKTQLGPAGTGGRGLDAEYGAEISFTRVSLEDNREAALSASEAGTRVTLTDAVVRGTRARADGEMGYGASLIRQARLTLTRAVLEQNQQAGLNAAAQADVVLTDVLVRDTLSSANLDDAGNGLVFEDGATATLTRCALLRNRTLGLLARATARVTASGLVVLDTATTSATGADGAGLEVESGARVVVDHAFLAGNHSAGISAEASAVTLSDVEVRDTFAGTAAVDIANGLQVSKGAAVDLARVRLAGNQALGVLVDGNGTTLEGSDLSVVDGRGTAAGGDGAALAAQGGATVTLYRVAFERNTSVAVQLTDPGTAVSLTDAVVTDTASDALGRWGRGVHVQGSARLSMARAVLERNLDVGVFVGAGAFVQLEDVRIADTGKRACVAQGSCDDRGGSGVVVLGTDAALKLTRFGLVRSVQCGLQLAEGGVADLSEGEVAESAIGASVLTEGFDLGRISDRVVYRDNARKLDALSMPLPEVTLPRY